MNIDANFLFRQYRDAIADHDPAQGAALPSGLAGAKPEEAAAWHSVALAVSRRLRLEDPAPPQGIGAQQAARAAARVSQSIGYVAPTAEQVSPTPIESPTAARSAQEAVTPQALSVAGPDAIASGPAASSAPTQQPPPPPPDAKTAAEKAPRK